MRDTFPHLGFRVAYDGSDFAGFQKQSHAHSVQSEIEKALSVFFKEKISLDFSSRTDSGVHAYDQWICIEEGFRLFESLSASQKKRWIISLNALLPLSIRIWSGFRLSSSYHPKNSALWKEYHYRILNSQVTDPFLARTHVWIRSPLDLNLMKSEIQKLKGTHDFSGFSKTSSLKRRRGEDRGVRTLLKTEVLSEPHPSWKEARLVTFKLRGTGFLHHMVRNIAGTLIEIGRAEDFSVSEILTSKDRTSAGPNSEAHGLLLYRTEVPKRLICPLPSED